MSDREGQSPTGLAFILYHSETDLTVGGDAAHALIDAAMRENRKRDLTGILYHERGVFLQWLEGPCDAVALVADRIERDTRHTGMVYLMRGSLPQRRFGQWRMAYTTQGGDSVLQWIADRGDEMMTPQSRNQVIAGFLFQRGEALSR